MFNPPTKAVIALPLGSCHLDSNAACKVRIVQECSHKVNCLWDQGSILKTPTFGQ